MCRLGEKVFNASIYMVMRQSLSSRRSQNKLIVIIQFAQIMELGCQRNHFDERFCMGQAKSGICRRLLGLMQDVADVIPIGLRRVVTLGAMG
jgi:hypothetical protein